MNRLGVMVLAGLMVSGVAISLHAADDRPIVIAMIGDSTMSNYEKPPADRPDLTGWGQVFGEQFTDRVKILNHAASGRSTRSFRAERRWQPVLDAHPDFVFIQFGHNDQKVDKPGYAAAETTFRDELRRYIRESREIHASPILVTPVARRTFENGKPVTILTPYAEAMFAVGTELDVPVIDLHARSLALYAELGDEGSANLTAAATDRTHFSRAGARRIAKLVAEEIRKQIPELAAELRP